MTFPVLKHKRAHKCFQRPISLTVRNPRLEQLRPTHVIQRSVFPPWKLALVAAVVQAIDLCQKTMTSDHWDFCGWVKVITD